MKFKWVVFFVVGHNEDMLTVASWFNTFNERTLCGIDDIYLIPLEKEV